MDGNYLNCRPKILAGRVSELVSRVLRTFQSITNKQQLRHRSSPSLNSTHTETILFVYNMLQRHILRQSRNLSKSLTELSQAQVRQSPFLSRTFITPRASILSTYLPSRLQRRWQSTESEQQKPSSDTTPSEEAKPVEAQPEDAVKTELEKSKREVIDLKVNQPPISPHHTCK